MTKNFVNFLIIKASQAGIVLGNRFNWVFIWRVFMRIGRVVILIDGRIVWEFQDGENLK
jgi:hypothetical protein